MACRLELLLKVQGLDLFMTRGGILLPTCFLVGKRNTKSVFEQSFHSLYEFDTNILVWYCYNTHLTISIIIIVETKPGH
jgi:hypothetical protein